MNKMFLYLFLSLVLGIVTSYAQNKDFILEDKLYQKLLSIEEVNEEVEPPIRPMPAPTHIVEIVEEKKKVENQTDPKQIRPLKKDDEKLYHQLLSLEENHVEKKKDNLNLSFSLGSSFIRLKSVNLSNDTKLDLSSSRVIDLSIDSQWSVRKWSIGMGYRLQAVKLTNTSNNDIINTSLSLSHINLSLQYHISSWARVSLGNDFKESLFQKSINNRLDVYKGYTMLPKLGMILTPLESDLISVETGISLGKMIVVQDRSQDFNGGMTGNFWIKNSFKLKEDLNLNTAINYESESTKNSNYDQHFQNLGFTIGLSWDF